MNKSMINALLGGMVKEGEEVYVTPVRLEGLEVHVRPHREGWHPDWSNQSEIPEWIKLVSGWKGNKYLLDGEEPLPVPITFECSENCVRSAGDISWSNLPAGTYYKVCVRHSSGKLLWEQAIGPITMTVGNTLTIYGIGMCIS